MIDVLLQDFQKVCEALVIVVKPIPKDDGTDNVGNSILYWMLGVERLAFNKENLVLVFGKEYFNCLKRNSTC